MSRNRIPFVFAACVLAVLPLSAALAADGDNLIRLPQSDKPPVVDGRISEGEYDRAVRLPRSFVRFMSFRKVNPMTGAYVARHGDRLYICWISPLREGEYPLSQCFTPDYTKICTDPSVAFFLDPPREPGEQLVYYHFIGNARGTYYDAKINPSIGQTFTNWDAEIEYRNSATTGGRWVSELSVPLEDFGIADAKIGDGLEFGLELARDGGFAPQCYSMAFHRPARFTRVVFDDSAPAVHVEDFGDFTGTTAAPTVVVSSDRAMEVTASFQVLSAERNAVTKERKVLGEMGKTGTLRAGEQAELSADLPVPDVEKGYARIRLADGEGKVVFQRTYPFNTGGYEYREVKKVERKPLTLSAYWAPSFGKVHVLADIYGLGREASQRTLVEVEVRDAEGKRLGEATIGEFRYGGGRTDVNLGQGLPEGEYTVRAVARTPGGDKLAESTTTYRRKRYEWEDSEVGYSDEVIKPWTPVKADGASVSVWGRTYRIGRFGLPAGIESLQPEPTRGHRIRQMLADPGRLVVVSRGERMELDASEPQLLKSDATEAIYGASAVSERLSYTMTGRMVYDGFYRLDLSLTPVRPVKLDRVSIEVPLQGDMARLLFSVGENKRKNNTAIALSEKEGVLWDSATAARNGIVKGNFLPYVWVGNEDRGLAWMANSDEGWVLDFDEPCLEVVRRGDQAIFRINLLNRPETLDRPIRASFSLQATPVRPRPPGGSWREATNFRWDFFGPGRGGRPLGGKFPDRQERENISKLAREHRKETRVFPYQNMAIGDKRQQAYRDFLGEWMVVPGYGGRTQVESHADWCLHCFQWWLEEAPADGLYFDCVFPVPNKNTLNGIGWVDAEGRLRAGYDMFEDRSFFRRVATYLRSLPQCEDTTVNIYMHTTDNANASQLGWAGCWLAGESGGRVKREGVEHPDTVDRWGHDPGLARLRAHALGRQYGVIPAWLYHYPKFGTVFGLHDIPHGLSDGVYKHTLGGEVRNSIDMRSEDLQFIPYWHVQDWYRVESGGRIKCSAWKLEDRVRLQVSNLNHENVRADLRLDLEFLGLPEDCEISRQTDGKVVEHEGGLIRGLPLRRHEYEVLLLAPEGVFDTGLARDDIAALNTGERVAALSETFEGMALDTDVWQPACGAGVTEYSIEPYYGTLRIRSTNGHYANVTRAFGRDNVSVRARIHRPEGGKADMPAVTLYWGKARYVQGGVTNPRSHENRPHRVRFGARRGGRSKSYGGPEARGVNWVRFDLQPEVVALYASADGETWKHIGDVPRKKDFVGAPSHLVLGFGTEEPDSDNTLLRNTSRTYNRGGSTAFFDEVIVEEM